MRAGRSGPRRARRSIPARRKTDWRSAGKHHQTTPMTDQLLAAVSLDTNIAILHTAHVVPALIAAAGEHASLRFLELFAGTIRNPHTRRAYGRAGADFG